MKDWLNGPLLALVLLCGATSAPASLISGAGYTATDEVPYTFIDISGTGTRVLAETDDDVFTADLEFSFVFFGTAFTSVHISSNGLLTFGDLNGDYSNLDLSSDIVSGGPAIAVFWDDLQSFQLGADAIYYETIGDPANRQFIVQWNSVGGYFTSPSTATFQAILFEGSNSILLSYADIDFGDGRTNGGSATVGIQNTDGAYLQWLAMDVGESEFDPPIFSGQTIQFTPSAVPEPGSLTLVALGTVGLGAGTLRRRMRRIRAT